MFFDALGETSGLWQAVGQDEEGDWVTWLSSRSSPALASSHGGHSKRVRPNVHSNLCPWLLFHVPLAKASPIAKIRISVETLLKSLMPEQEEFVTIFASITVVSCLFFIF